MRLYATVRFDREIDPEKHYICPGGYALRTPSGGVIPFDFEEYDGSVDTEDRTILDYRQKGLDTDAFPESTGLSATLAAFAEHLKLLSFSEFFVYTGEAGEPEIDPVEVLFLTIEDGDEEYEFPQNVLEEINAMWRNETA